MFRFATALQTQDPYPMSDLARKCRDYAIIDLAKWSPTSSGSTTSVYCVYTNVYVFDLQKDTFDIGL